VGGRLPASVEAPELVGLLTREEIVAALPDWADSVAAAEPDRPASLDLAAAGAGAEVVIFLGSWCSDSRRELSRLWRALDVAGGEAAFDITYVGVDRSKRLPTELLTGADLRFVPTFVVKRGGQEVGRVVESAPSGIERDLLLLLSGRAKGLVTARTDLVSSPEGRADP
jgi:hypothetical protein